MLIFVVFLPFAGSCGTVYHALWYGSVCILSLSFLIQITLYSVTKYGINNPNKLLKMRCWCIWCLVRIMDRISKSFFNLTLKFGKSSRYFDVTFLFCGWIMIAFCHRMSLSRYSPSKNIQKMWYFPLDKRYASNLFIIFRSLD